MEGASDSNNLFNLPNIRVATVKVVMYSGDGSEECLVGIGVVDEGDRCLCPAEWCTTGGITTWNCRYRGRYVFLVGVVELTGGGLVGVWEVAILDADEGNGCLILYV